MIDTVSFFASASLYHLRCAEQYLSSSLIIRHYKLRVISDPAFPSIDPIWHPRCSTMAGWQIIGNDVSLPPQ